jgi:hypothetical protein
MRLVVLPLLTACFGIMEVSGIFYDTQTMSNPGYCDTFGYLGDAIIGGTKVYGYYANTRRFTH